MQPTKTEKDCAYYRIQTHIARIPSAAARLEMALPTTNRGISHYIERMLKPAQQAACDMATD